MPHYSIVTLRRRSFVKLVAAMGALLMLALFLVACSPPIGDVGVGTPEPGPLPTPTFRPGEEPKEQGEWNPEPTHPMMDQVWQPPEPKKRVALALPTQVIDSPDAMLVYEMAALGGIHDIQKVTQDGVLVLGGNQGGYTTYKLSPDEFARIKELVAGVDFFNLADRYWVEDPPGVIAEIPIVTITYKEDGQSKSVKLRGSGRTPQALRDLQTDLEDLADKAREQGTVTRTPDRLVSYYVQGTEYVWWLDIDVEGGIYYSSNPPEARLSPEELAVLRSALEGIRSLGRDEWYAPPEHIRDTLFMDEHRAIVTTYENGQSRQRLDMVSGATIPDELQAVMTMLVDVYDKYAPNGSSR